jgi:hypothetical protein
MLWDPALFVFLYYRALAEREQAAARAQLRGGVRQLQTPPKHARKRSGTAAARAHAIWSRQAAPTSPRATGAAIAQVIKLPRR